MEHRHKEDYTQLLPVFVSHNDQTRALCAPDMDYAIEKAVKAIDKHSITVKPRRRKNKDSKSYQNFRKKKEFNNQLDKCYLLLGKSYFYRKKYAMANNTFRFIHRQYAEDEKLLRETAVWMFRSLTEMERYDEALQWMDGLAVEKLKRKQREMVYAAQVDFYVRQKMYAQAIPAAEKLIQVGHSLKRRPRYNFILAQLYLKLQQDGKAMAALKKSVRFNFNYEMVFNARINMALAYREGDAMLEKKLVRMLRDSRNKEYRDRIYYALGNIDEKRGEEEKAIDWYRKSVRASVNNENQQSLSFRKLGDYYFKKRDYVQAQCCYDSCVYFMNSQAKEDEQLKVLLNDLTELTRNLQIIYTQDSLLKLAQLPENERNQIIDSQIQAIKDQEKALRQKEQTERIFLIENKNASSVNTFSQGAAGGSDWYFYNPLTLSLGKNEFGRKWGRRKLEDNWRRKNKAVVDFSELVENNGTEKEGISTGQERKNREYYLKNIPLTREDKKVAQKKLENAYYTAGELYMYKFSDPPKALACFEACIKQAGESNNLPMMYYLAHLAAEKAGNREQSDWYKQQLITRFPDNDFARGVQDPEYFKKVEDVLKTVEKLYEKAYNFYKQVYYEEAGKICDEILRQYPDNKLKPHVLFLKAMCMLNTCSPEESRKALTEVLDSSPAPEIQSVVNDILASLSTGNKPIVYTVADKLQERSLLANRNWTFDEEVSTGELQKEKTTYQENKKQTHIILIILPEDFALVEEKRFKARLSFINISEATEGKNYEMKEEKLWGKQNSLQVGKFEQAEEAMEYIKRVAADKNLLKIIGSREYRIFAIGIDNLSVLKRLKNIESYVDFFVKCYFTESRQGEILTGKRGIAAQIFADEENDRYHFVLSIPSREINVRRMAEAIQRIEPTLERRKEVYDYDTEFMVVKNVGTRKQAIEFMDIVLKDKGVFDLLTGSDYQCFVITDQNLKVLKDNDYLNEYVQFFNDYYLEKVQTGKVEKEGYIYKKDIPHQFVLLYSNTIEKARLEEGFREFNFAGLTLHSQSFDDQYDCLVVSGFNDREEAMRYFYTVLNTRKLYKPLKSADYTNFVITEANLQTLTVKRNIDIYLEFFKKHYLNGK